MRIDGSPGAPPARSFHRRCCRGITGEFIHQGEDGEWVCPDSNDVMEKAGVLTIEDNFTVRANKRYVWKV
jgi:hypothetical protein